MKSTLAPAPVRPLTVKKFTTSRLPAGKHRNISTAVSAVPPSEETVQLLNGIAREYPFCVYYKEKRNDPL